MSHISVQCSNWLRYHLAKVEKCTEFASNMSVAEDFHGRRLLRYNLAKWRVSFMG